MRASKCNHKWGRAIKPAPVAEDFGTTAEWYLTVRCTNPACARLIAFQKARFPGDDANLRLAVTGAPSVDCPHCKTLVRFRLDQIERRQVMLTQ
jgi:hypothetical protein